MKELEKHREALEVYYRLRNILATSRETGISRQSLGKWKAEFHWDDECADRDHEVNQQVREIMTPEWVEVKLELVHAFTNQIKAAMAAKITPENSRDMVAVSRELRALMGDADRHEIEFTGIEYVLTEAK